MVGRLTWRQDHSSSPMISTPCPAAWRSSSRSRGTPGLTMICAALNEILAAVPAQSQATASGLQILDRGNQRKRDHSYQSRSLHDPWRARAIGTPPVPMHPVPPPILACFGMLIRLRSCSSRQNPFHHLLHPHAPRPLMRIQAPLCQFCLQECNDLPVVLSVAALFRPHPANWAPLPISCAISPRVMSRSTPKSATFSPT